MDVRGGLQSNLCGRTMIGAHTVSRIVTPSLLTRQRD
jgi:hypothetical protein